MGNEPVNKRVVLITGAAGGLGGALVEAFAQTGYTVVAGWNQHEPAPASNLADVRMDVTSSESVNAAIAEVFLKCGRLDVLVNNAGLTVNNLLGQTSDEEWEQVLKVNLSGCFHCSRAVVRHFLKQRSGHIINISSFAARSGPRGQTAYASAKAAMIGFTQALAKEAGARDVRVNAVLPGVLSTPMTSDLPASVMEDFARANVLGRINKLDEVARFIAFLADTRNISGQVFQLDSRIAPWT